MNAALWLQVNKNLVAKSIGELSYEQILQPVLRESDLYELKLQSGVTYQFTAWKSVWDHLRVQPKSIERSDSSIRSTAISAGQFFIDAQAELEMTDITLAHFLEEMHNTLYSDLKLAEKNKDLSVETMTLWNGHQVQSVLNGHPKILLNKGRMGWTVKDLAAYAPESQKSFQLHWIAVNKQHLIVSDDLESSLETIYEQSLSDLEVLAFRKALSEKDVKPSDYYFMPVHPSQWERIIQLHFSAEIAMNQIISLGQAGDQYQAQISLRTLSNITRPEKDDIKLPLSILNTSAVRGIPARYIKSAAKVSRAVAKICQTDSVLIQAGTDLLEDKWGEAYVHPLYAQVKGAPYRYNETLGSLWRQSVQSKLAEGEIGIITGSLFHQDHEGRSLIGAYIRKSGLSTEKWLEAYFDKVVIPLYHLQLKYGLGLVAHGQNVVLKLKNFIPQGILLKDFQGDLRLSADHKSEWVHDLVPHLDQLPPHYVIHDLITGHFVTVLRFVSAVLQESDQFSEESFYKILSDRVKLYLKHNTSQAVPASIDILSEKTSRVLLNKVRFKIGYADTAERPLPLVGSDLSNPLRVHGDSNE